MKIVPFLLQKSYSCRFTSFDSILIPDGGLDLADMGAAHHQHTETALTDTAANGQGQLVIQKHFMEGELSAVITAGDRQLTVQSLGIHTDTIRYNELAPYDTDKRSGITKGKVSYLSYFPFFICLE